MKIAIIGPPGAGKTSLTERIAREFKLTKIEVGVILRKNKSFKIGNKTIGEYIDGGNLAPHKIIWQFILDELKEIRFDNFVMDGFPREIEQLEHLKNVLKLDRVIFLNTNLKTCLERIKNRFVCKNCGASFHTKYLPPKKSGICDFCAMKLEKRDDGGMVALKRRFEIYNMKTSKVIDEFKNMEILEEINGNQKFEKVRSDVKNILRGMK